MKTADERTQTLVKTARAPWWSAAVTVPFRLLGRWRGARVFHPHGLIHTGTLRLDQADLLDGAGSYDVIARVSKSISTPGDLPDLLGIALHIPTEQGLVDLLFATTGSRAGLRHVLVPRQSFTSGVYTTLLPYQVAGRTRIIGLLPIGDRTVPTRLNTLDAAINRRPLEFVIAVATLTGDWEPRGILEITAPWTGADISAFDPQVHHVPRLSPTGPFQTVRRLAYLGSRIGSRREP